MSKDVIPNLELEDVWHFPKMSLRGNLEEVKIFQCVQHPVYAVTLSCMTTFLKGQFN